MTEPAADNLPALTQATQQQWDEKAEFWDNMMKEGNAFHNHLVGPTAERLLAIQPGETVLDVACGNGQFSRRLAQLGARVLATDFSAGLLERAQARTTENQEQIEYRQVDATSEAQLLALGEQRFEAAICNMALMDMPVIDPLFNALRRLLKPRGRFVFTLMHPCFNSADTRLGLEEEDLDGTLVETYYVKMSNYLHLPPKRGAGAPGEPNPHYYFQRPLHELFNSGFKAGFVLDGLEEPAFAQEIKTSKAISWGHYKHIPPVLAARMRLI